MMDANAARAQLGTLDGVETVVAHPVVFKAQLGIGEDSYTSLWLVSRIQKSWSLYGAAAGGAAAANSSIVASLFSGGSWLTVIGLGGAAVTPIGWVIAGSAVSACAYYGVTRLFAEFSDSQVVKVPRFINTPLDLLAVSLLDLLLPIALRIAAADGEISEEEISEMTEHLVSDWGYDRDYVARATAIVMANVSDARIDDMTRALRDFIIRNPDCNPTHIRKILLDALRDIARADGHISEMEEMALSRVEKYLHRSWTDAAMDTGRTVSDFGSSIGSKVDEASSALGTYVEGGLRSGLKSVRGLFRSSIPKDDG